MEITRNHLTQRFQDLNDVELLRRVRSGGLTDLAREVAMAEIHERQLVLEVSAEQTGAVPEETIIDAVLAPDEFERNPYQAPRSQARSSTPPPRSWLWWGYFGYVCLTALLGVAGMLTRPESTVTPMVVIGTLVNIWAIVGVWGWLRRIPLVHPWLWVACLAVTASLLSLSIKALLTMLRDNPETLSLIRENSALLLPMHVITLILTLPLLLVLWRYAYTSAAIWKQ